MAASNSSTVVSSLATSTSTLTTTLVKVTIEMSTSTTPLPETTSPHKSPLLWSFIVQIVCSILLVCIVHLTLRRVKRQYVSRVEEMDRQLRKMDLRLRMQQPSIALVHRIAHKMSLPLDDEAGEKNRVNMLVEGSAMPMSEGPAAALLPGNQIRLEEPERTQQSSMRQVASPSKRLMRVQK